MKIATILNTHGETELVLDTLDAIKYYVGNKTVVVVDGAHWDTWGINTQLPAYKVQGFHHNHSQAPYKNLTLGLQTAIELFGDQMDWYCYTEYDVLFTSSDFKRDLIEAKKRNVWCLGNDHRVGKLKLPLLEKIIEEKLNLTYYMLGCCVFYSGEFIRKLQSIDFFNKFLFYTSGFNEGFFPGCDEYDFGEHLYPTLASHYGGKLGTFASWNLILSQWQGNFKQYPMRWQPELDWEDNFPQAHIMHPVKNSDLRWFHRTKRDISRRLNGEV